MFGNGKVHPEFVHFLYSPKRILSDIKNREVIIKDVKSYIYSRTRLIRLIRHFFVGPGRIPIFCVHFCSSNSPSSNPSICSIRHLFRSL